MTKYPLTSQYRLGIVGLARKLNAEYMMPNDMEDFKQVAILTACQVEETFDKTKGLSFYSFIKKPIKNKIQVEFGNPKAGSRLYKQIQLFITEFQNAEGCAPTVLDISRGLQVSTYQVIDTYYDRHHEVLLDVLPERYENTHTVVEDSLGILSAEELKVVTSIYYKDLTAQDVANDLKVDREYVIKVQESALTKLKGIL